MRRNRHVDTGLMDKSDLSLNKQQYWAKVTLKAIENQVLHKPKFENQFTIRYEDFTTSLEPTLKKIENKFGIIANLEKALNVIQKPSRSPKSTHEIKEISDPIALEIIYQERKLWKYL